MSIADIVDLHRYPIDTPCSIAAQKFTAQCRRQYADDGLCVLPEFILPAARRRLASEADAASGDAYFCDNTHNAYLTADDPNLSADDVARRSERTFVGSVAYDQLGDHDALRKLYEWNPLKDFIGGVLGKPKLHRFADPLGACSINVFTDGGRHGWHFDESEFSVSLMLQSPIAGGEFEYVPRIRGRSDEKKIVARLLDGDCDEATELPFTAGTLLIFGGNQTIHRVVKVTGNRARLTAILCYSEAASQKNSEAVRELFWGRSG